MGSLYRKVEHLALFDLQSVVDGDSSFLLLLPEPFSFMIFTSFIPFTVRMHFSLYLSKPVNVLCFRPARRNIHPLTEKKKDGKKWMNKSNREG